MLRSKQSGASFFSMARLLRSDPLSSRSFHAPPRPPPIDPQRRRVSVRGIGVGGFNLKSRFDAQNRRGGSWARNAGGVFAPHPQVVRDFDAELASGGRRRGSLPEKVVIAVDVDEVLGSFLSALNRFIAERYSMNHSVSEYHVYEFFKVWDCSRDEADIRVHEFFKTSYFKSDIHPLPGAQKALHKLSKLCNLSVVTSRQIVIKDQTIEWVEKHYPGLFQEIHFGNHFALDGGESRSKSDICGSLGAKVLIDDNPRYAIECAEAGIRVLLFDFEKSYPWCKNESVAQHPLITKVHNWEEVETKLISWITN